MNLELKAAFICVTSGHRWGKGLTIAEAKKNAGLIKKAQESNCQFYVMAAIFNNPNEAELKNLLACITSNAIDGGPEYYRDDRTEEDTQMIDEKHVGWLTVEKNF